MDKITRYGVKKYRKIWHKHTKNRARIANNKLQHNTPDRYKERMFSWTLISFKGSAEGVKYKSDRNYAAGWASE